MKESLAGVILFLSFFTDVDAQYLGIRAGLNLSTMVQKDFTMTYSSGFEMIPGFQAGPASSFPVSRSVCFETSAMLATKGYIYKYTEDYQGQPSEYRENMELYYLEIPAFAKIYIPPRTNHFYIAFGPYAGIGLSGKHILARDGQDYEVKKIRWGSDPQAHDLTRTDFGFSAGTGIEINRFQIGFSYEQSLVSVSPYSDYGFKEFNRVYSIMLVYKFLKWQSELPESTAN